MENLDLFIELNLDELTTELTSEELVSISGGGTFGLAGCCNFIYSEK